MYKITGNKSQYDNMYLNSLKQIQTDVYNPLTNLSFNFETFAHSKYNCMPNGHKYWPIYKNGYILLGNLKLSVYQYNLNDTSDPKTVSNK